MTPDQIASLIEIAGKAIEVHKAEADRKFYDDCLGSAYGAWKERHGIERVERDTLDWSRMMVATRPEYEQLQQAKTDERNARRRLATAISRYLGRAAG